MANEQVVADPGEPVYTWTNAWVVEAPADQVYEGMVVKVQSRNGRMKAMRVAAIQVMVGDGGMLMARCLVEDT